jgi:hypothetical protein
MIGKIRCVHAGGWQSGTADFPWCVRRGASLADGFVEVRFKPLSGRRDQAGGVVWRWKDGDNYYVARANAIENNVSLYYTERGSRKTLKYVDAPVAANQWHTIRVASRDRGSRCLSMAANTSRSTTSTSRARALWAYGQSRQRDRFRQLRVRTIDSEALPCVTN